MEIEKRYDIHKATAAAMYGVPEDEVTLKMRETAKIFNISSMYGVSPELFAKKHLRKE